LLTNKDGKTALIPLFALENQLDHWWPDRGWMKACADISAVQRKEPTLAEVAITFTRCSSPWQQKTQVFYPSPATRSLFSSEKYLNFASSGRTKAKTEIKLD